MGIKKGFVVWKLFGGLWLLCVLLFVGALAYATDWFHGTIQATKFGNSTNYLILVVTTLGFGCLFFIVFLLSFSLSKIKPSKLDESKPKESNKHKFIKFVGKILFLPFILLNQTVNFSKLVDTVLQGDLFKTFRIKVFIKKLVSVIVISPIVAIWLGGYVLIFYIAFLFLGLSPIPTDVSGQSMLPTFKDGESIRLRSYSPISQILFPLKKGDIVTFENENTITQDGKRTTFVKRVVALAGDKVETRDGFLYVNGQIVNEPYIEKPRSTFGNKFLSDCKSVEVPEGDIFVLGDNRARSEDSRYLGFVSIKDIKGFLPTTAQNKYTSRWHDASKDSLMAGFPSFDKEQYYEDLNKIRVDNGLKPLKINNKLETASLKRSEAIINFDELKVSPDSSKYPPKKAQDDSGYSNIVYGEINTSGYFEAEDLANYWMQYNTKETILDKNYQDTGIGSVVGKINGCETQIIVQEFGGYVPPNYKQSDIDSWQHSLDGLRNIQSGWAGLKNNPSFYSQHKTDVDRINEIISIRISRIESIISTMKANKWLSSEQNQWIKEEQGFYNEQETLANRLNGK